jgi:hypothetical protein
MAVGEDNLASQHASFFGTQGAHGHWHMGAFYVRDDDSGPLRGAIVPALPWR